eukprot:TRINITY_DN2845_c1_g1_i1.p1 TRINITY_DN2845_c1_g1~~TRINITY_DN2845_c1_g1_i1.p1  ORF type:complete len:251 (+),score=47.66 TRINITY_DN2845_c1_g1_i1:379-1131(+)
MHKYPQVHGKSWQQWWWCPKTVRILAGEIPFCRPEGSTLNGKGCGEPLTHTLRWGFFVIGRRNKKKKKKKKKKKMETVRQRCAVHHKDRDVKFMAHTEHNDRWVCRPGKACKTGAGARQADDMSKQEICAIHWTRRSMNALGMREDGLYECVQGKTCLMSESRQRGMCVLHQKKRNMDYLEPCDPASGHSAFKCTSTHKCTESPGSNGGGVQRQSAFWQEKFPFVDQKAVLSMVKGAGNPSPIPSAGVSS